MKLIENVKMENEEIIKVLGVPVFSIDRGKNTKHQSFLGGMVTADKRFVNGDIEKRINIFGFPLKKYTQQGNLRRSYLFGFKYRENDLGKSFYLKHKELFDKYDDIYILHANIGESVVFLDLAPAYFKKNCSKNPLIVGISEYHRDLAKMICPEYDVEIIKSPKISLFVDKFEAGGHTFRIMFPKPYYDGVEENLRNKNVPTIHFKEQISKFMELKSDSFRNTRPQIKDEIQAAVREKIANCDLNLDNFVLFTPEANTCADCSLEFWQNLKQEYESKGFDVFCNARKEQQKYSDFKTCDLSLMEVYALAETSKEIVGLRSGLLDLLVLTGKPMKVFYTKARERESYNPLTANEIFEGFYMKEYKNVEEIVMEKA